MSDPFLLAGPALISFSGGRTSAYLLWRTIQAFDGKLPADVHVCFANTGKEREETLRFVHDCASHWDVQIRWLEWRADGFEEVGFNSASRNGEPFAELIRKRGFLPNAVTRFCTTALKVQTMGKFMRAQGYDRWLNAVGLRHDEGLRCLKAYARNAANKERFTTVLPLDKAFITKRDVLAFWKEQTFDLRLAHEYEGNCDYCFLKGRGKLSRIVRDGTVAPDWWIEQERAVTATARTSGARFVTEWSYADLVRDVHAQPLLVGDELLEGDYDAECGLTCAGEAA